MEERKLYLCVMIAFRAWVLLEQTTLLHIKKEILEHKIAIERHGSKGPYRH